MTKIIILLLNFNFISSEVPKEQQLVTAFLANDYRQIEAIINAGYKNKNAFDLFLKIYFEQKTDSFGIDTLEFMKKYQISEDAKFKVDPVVFIITSHFKKTYRQELFNSTIFCSSIENQTFESLKNIDTSFFVLYQENCKNGFDIFEFYNKAKNIEELKKQVSKDVTSSCTEKIFRLRHFPKLKICNDELANTSKSTRSDASIK